MVTALAKADGQLRRALLNLEHVSALHERLCRTPREASDPSGRCQLLETGVGAVQRKA